MNEKLEQAIDEYMEEGSCTYDISLGEDSILDEDERCLRDMDGKLDIHRMNQLLLEQRQLHAQVFNMKRILIGLMIFVLVLGLSNLGTAWAAAVLVKDAQTDHLVSIENVGSQVLTTNGHDRQIIVSKRTTISKEAAEHLFAGCLHGNTVLTVLLPSGGKQVVSVCPANSYVQDGNEYIYSKDEKVLQILCIDNASDCQMKGNMLQRPNVKQAMTPDYKDILNADYENGDISSGISGLVGTHATANDAAYVADFGRNSDHSVCHKALLNDASYRSSGKSRSESDTIDVHETRYFSGDEFVYRFSLLLDSWEDSYVSGQAPMDVIWQFKHTHGGSDAIIGVQRNSLVLRYGENNAQAILVADMTGLNNQWIDVETHIKWADTDTGFLQVMVRTSGELVEAFRVENFRTFTSNGSGEFGFLKWGLYRPDSTVDNDYNERIACHDNVRITKITYSF